MPQPKLPDPIELIQASGRKVLRLGLLAVLLIAGVYVAFNSLEHVDQNQIMVIQYPSGSMSWFQNGGYHLQWFGKVEKYNKRSQYWFSAKNDQGKEVDQSIKVKFNDGGHGFLSGSVAWEMPTDTIHLTQLYQKYGDAHAIEQDLVRTVVEKSVTMTGPLMSSKESYAERRNDLIRFIEDQIATGVYQTETVEKQQIDPLSGEKRTVNAVQLKESNGIVLRQEVSPLHDFGIRTYNLSINGLDYDDTVEKQIASQQAAVMQVQTAIAQAKQAEQQAITAAKNGEAEAAKAKWEQEVIKARAVTEGEQKLEVAQLDAKSAEQFKIAETLRGEGEGARRRAVMQADGALEKKLNAWIQVNQYYADAIKNHPGDWVPKVQMGGGGGLAGGGNASELIQLFTAKTAHDISLDLTLPGERK
jgi:regulator of protease activity HflC (stomatin/prohibitin superfamily)